MKEKISRAKLTVLITGLVLLLLIPVGVFARYGIAAPKEQAAPTSQAAYPGPGTSGTLVLKPGIVSGTIVPPEVAMLNIYQEELKAKKPER